MTQPNDNAEEIPVPLSIPTPRCNAVCYTDEYGEQYVDAEVARQIERELTARTAELEEARTALASQGRLVKVCSHMQSVLCGADALIQMMREHFLESDIPGNEYAKHCLSARLKIKYVLEEYAALSTPSLPGVAKAVSGAAQGDDTKLRINAAAKLLNEVKVLVDDWTHDETSKGDYSLVIPPGDYACVSNLLSRIERWKNGFDLAAMQSASASERTEEGKQ